MLLAPDHLPRDAGLGSETASFTVPAHLEARPQHGTGTWKGLGGSLQSGLIELLGCVKVAFGCYCREGEGAAERRRAAPGAFGGDWLSDYLLEPWTTGPGIYLKMGKVSVGGTWGSALGPMELGRPGCTRREAGSNYHLPRDSGAGVRGIQPPGNR